MPDRCDYDLFLVFDLESLRARSDGDKKRFGANRLPVSFQAREAKGAVLASAVLQNFACGYSGYDKELGS